MPARDKSVGRKKKNNSDDEMRTARNQSSPTPSVASSNGTNASVNSSSSLLMARHRSNYEVDDLQNIRESCLSRAQLRRSISFIDVSDDGNITRHELLGALSSTDLSYPEVQSLIRLLNPDNAHECNLSDVRKRLVQLLGDKNMISPGTTKANLALRALIKLLQQREDDATSFDKFRLFKGLAVSLFPCFATTWFTKYVICNQACCGKNTTSVFIPEFFKSSNPYWSKTQWTALLSKLEHTTSKESNVRFGLSDVVFKLEHIRTKNEMRDRNSDQIDRHKLPHSYFIKFVTKIKMNDGRLQTEKKTPYRRQSHLDDNQKKCIIEMQDDETIFTISGLGNIYKALTCKIVPDKIFDISDIPEGNENVEKQMKKNIARALGRSGRNTFQVKGENKKSLDKEEQKRLKRDYKIAENDVKRAKKKNVSAQQYLDDYGRQLDENNLKDARQELKNTSWKLKEMTKTADEANKCLEEFSIQQLDQSNETNNSSIHIFPPCIRESITVKTTIDQKILEKIIKSLEQMQHPENMNIDATKLTTDVLKDEKNEEIHVTDFKKKWDVGIWEMRLNCFPRDPEEIHVDYQVDYQNHLEGSEIVYQHETQSIEVFEAGGRSIPLVLRLGDSDEDEDDGLAVPNSSRSSGRTPSVYDKCGPEEELEARGNYDNPMREIKKIAQSVVRSQSWSRMMFQKILIKISVSVMLILCLIDRYEGNEDRYDSFLKVNGTCDVNQINQTSAKYGCFENIVSIGEFTRVLVLFLFMSALNAYKNAWNIPEISTKTKAMEDIEVEEEKFISMLGEISTSHSRIGIHHKVVGYIAPQLMAIVWSLVPLYNRAYRNTRRNSLYYFTEYSPFVYSNITQASFIVQEHNKNFKNLWFGLVYFWPTDGLRSVFSFFTTNYKWSANGRLMESYKFMSYEIAAVSWIGTSDFKSWTHVDQFTAFLCLLSVSAILAEVVARFCTVIWCYCWRKKGWVDRIFDKIFCRLFVAINILLGRIFVLIVRNVEDSDATANAPTHGSTAANTLLTSGSTAEEIIASVLPASSADPLTINSNQDGEQLTSVLFAGLLLQIYSNQGGDQLTSVLFAVLLLQISIVSNQGGDQLTSVLFAVLLLQISIVYYSKFYLSCSDKCFGSKTRSYDLVGCSCFRNIRSFAATTLAILVPCALALALTVIRLFLNESTKHVLSLQMVSLILCIVHFIIHLLNVQLVDLKQLFFPIFNLQVLIWSPCILIYILTSTWCGVIHQSYHYFENLAEQFKIFTKASSHSSWYQFYRAFANKNETSSHVSIDRKKIEKKIRDSKSFDLTNPSDLTKWNKARDTLVASMTSGATTVNEINLKMHTCLTAIFLIISCLSSYILVLGKIKVGGQEDKNVYISSIDLNNFATPDSFTAEFGWVFLSICSFFLVPMLNARYAVTRQDTQQLELLKNTKTRVEIHGIENEATQNSDEKNVGEIELGSRDRKLELRTFLESLNLIEHLDRLVTDGVECTEDLINHLSEEYLVVDLGIGKFKAKKLLANIKTKKMKDQTGVKIEALDIIIKKVEDGSESLRPTICEQDIWPLANRFAVGLITSLFGAYLLRVSNDEINVKEMWG
jgi:hypothetical protein